MERGQFKAKRNAFMLFYFLSENELMLQSELQMALMMSNFVTAL